MSRTESWESVGPADLLLSRWFNCSLCLLPLSAVHQMFGWAGSLLSVGGKSHAYIRVEHPDYLSRSKLVRGTWTESLKRYVSFFFYKIDGQVKFWWVFSPAEDTTKCRVDRRTSQVCLSLSWIQQSPVNIWQSEQLILTSRETFCLQSGVTLM